MGNEEAGNHQRESEKPSALTLLSHLAGKNT
jgi:hypothetical protein